MEIAKHVRQLAFPSSYTTQLNQFNMQAMLAAFRRKLVIYVINFTNFLMLTDTLDHIIHQP